MMFFYNSMGYVNLTAAAALVFSQVGASVAYASLPQDIDPRVGATEFSSAKEFKSTSECNEALPYKYSYNSDRSKDGKVSIYDCKDDKYLTYSCEDTVKGIRIHQHRANRTSSNILKKENMYYVRMLEDGYADICTEDTSESRPALEPAPAN